MNILNGGNNDDGFFGFNNTNSMNDGEEGTLLYEVGCKVFEVNRVHYTSSPGGQSDFMYQ